MNRFPGFPSRPDYVPIPRLFFSDLLPAIEDSAELVVSLQLFRMLALRKGYPRAVSEEDVWGGRPRTGPQASEGAAGNLAQAQRSLIPDPEGARRGLAAALERGTFLRAVTPRGDAWVLLNTEGDRRAAAAIEQGTLQPGEAGAVAGRSLPLAPRPADIFSLYEQVVGLLSPMIVERLKEAEAEYPAVWVEEAFRLAEEHNKRSWRYVEAILKRWKTEGKDDGTAGRHSAAERVDYSGWVQAARRQRR